MIEVSVVKNVGESKEDKTIITTKGCAVIYMVEDKVKIMAEFPLSAFTPYLLKILSDRIK